MNPDLPRLTPGIVSIFFPLGYTVNVTEVADQLGVTLSRGDWSESRTFPFPSVNRDLSIPLRAWRAQLLSQEQEQP